MSSSITIHTAVGDVRRIVPEGFVLRSKRRLKDCVCEKGGLRHCDLVAVTEDGVKVLTQF